MDDIYGGIGWRGGGYHFGGIYLTWKSLRYGSHVSSFGTRRHLFGPDTYRTEDGTLVRRD